MALRASPRGSTGLSEQAVPCCSWSFRSLQGSRSIGASVLHPPMSYSSGKPVPTVVPGNGPVAKAQMPKHVRNPLNSSGMDSKKEQSPSSSVTFPQHPEVVARLRLLKLVYDKDIRLPQMHVGDFITLKSSFELRMEEHSAVMLINEDRETGKADSPGTLMLPVVEMNPELKCQCFRAYPSLAMSLCCHAWQLR
ncbi:hypothetical protein MLD38_027463 [Melastoma candidum]|uniref:Uncharacterized protein n=1 Tax=Melastoma candidum TaxID=119954 RepID=A0ACB9P1M8_9MYRT|nr:hypothetical protein MLD38_027463 [Melastoma candidum]